MREGIECGVAGKEAELRQKRGVGGRCEGVERVKE